MPSKPPFHMLVLSTLVCVTLSQTSLYANAFAADAPGKPAGAGHATAPAAPQQPETAAPPAQPVAGVPAAAGPASAASPRDPGIAAIKNALTSAAIAHGIPPEILYAVAFQESRWRQYDDDGRPLVTDDGGIGIMQVTSYGGYDVSRLQSDVVYNINAGADILSMKFDNSPMIGDGRRDCYENWYFAVWAYNGWTPENGYADAVWSLIAAGPNGWWTGVPVTPVSGDHLDDGLGISVPTPQPAHVWSKAPAAAAAPSPAPAVPAPASAPPQAAPGTENRSRPVSPVSDIGKVHAGELVVIPDGEPPASTAFEDEYRKLVSQLTRVTEQNPESVD